MIIVMAQRKGGVGKSTLTASMAAKFSELGYKVGVLDSDEQKTLKHWGERRIDHGRDDIEVRWSQGDIRDNIKGMKERNDIILIDAGGYDTSEMRYAVACADIAISPFKPKQFDLETYPVLKEIIELILPVNPDLKHFAVINYAPPGANDSRARKAVDYLESVGINCLKSKAYNREAWGDCTWDGRGVSEYDDEKAAFEINKLCKEVLSHVC